MRPAMAKDFPVPPVVFMPSTLTHRRHPPPGADHPCFMSAAAAAASSSLPRSVSVSCSSLEDLGIDTRQIWRRAASVLLHPLRPTDPSLHADADLRGALLVLLAFALLQLLAGKLHVTAVLVWAAAASLALHLVFSMFSGRRRGGLDLYFVLTVFSPAGRGCRRGELELDLYRCATVVGYCMLPMAAFSAASLFLLPRGGGGGVVFAVGMGFVMWSARACAMLLAELARVGDEYRGLAAYACWIVYMIFSLLVIF